MERVLQFPPSRFGLPLDALPRRIGLLNGGAYAERVYGRWSVYCNSSLTVRVTIGLFLPCGAGYRSAEYEGERVF